ncbi:MAG TPA: ABC transporter substrate-binding protein [Thermoleophilia bacterium]|nr:ABC transporter substrate-binding protein [Thermoleophilia bacterium]
MRHDAQTTRSEGGPSRTGRWPARAVSTAAALTLLSATVLLLVATHPAAASPPASPPAAQLEYRIGTSQECDGVNPFRSWSSVSWECFRLGYDFLTWYDTDYRPAPDIATSWQASADGLTWTFHLRDGMEWQDGVPLTARDVVFTYDLVLKTRQPAYIQYLSGVRSVEAPDDATVVITTRRPKADMLAIGIPILPEHIWKKVDPDRLSEFTNLPFVGSGPFRVSGLQGGRDVTLEPNPAYPQALGGPPALTKLTFVIGRDSASLLEDYRAGKLDAVTDFPATLQPAYAGVRGSRTVAAPAIGFHELGFNCWQSTTSKGNPLLRDASIRRAVHWAIDDQKIVATAMAGLAVPGGSVISPAQGEWFWEVPKDAQYTYDPQRAKQILEDAGYSDRDADGVREDAAGRKLSFRLVALTEYPADQEAARMIVGWCRDVGIDLHLQVMSEAAFSDHIYDHADYDLFVWSWGGDIDPSFILSTFTTRQIMSWSDSQYSDPVYDRLYQLQSQAVDPADPQDTKHRRDLVVAMQKVLYRDDPYAVLWYNVNLQAFRTDRWAGYVTAPGRGGAPFFDQLRNTYVSLRPVRPEQPMTESSGAWMWSLVAVGVAVAAVGFAVVRRRPRTTEDA